MIATVLANGEARCGIDAARRVLEAGGTALDAVEQGIRPVEADPAVDSVGRGGKPRLTGEVELDAAMMDGRTLAAGAVGCLRGFLHPVSVARAVMERLPHVYLVGTGAERFAREVGAERAELLTPGMAERHRQWLATRVTAEDRARWAEAPLARYAHESGRDYVSGGTAVFLALDREGNIAVATSTSGWGWGYPGRIGDTPVVGAGLYADNRYGACACTHTGEMTIRQGTARAVVAAMRHGATVFEACRDAIAELRGLRAGTLGPVVVHALDVYGNPCVMSTHELGEKSQFVLWRSGMESPESDPAEVPA